MSPHLALALAFEAAGALLPRVEPAPSQLVERCAFVMGAPCEGAVLAPSRGAGLKALEAAFGAIAGLDRLLSDYDPQSELSQLNRWPSGEPRTCSTELLSLLARAGALQLETAGAFDPGIGALVQVWDLRGAGRVPAPPALARARSASGFSLLALDLGVRTATRLHPELQLDPGAFGKGAALDRAAAALRAQGAQSALIDFGGQVVALGSGPSGQEWRVAIADPGDRSRPIARLGLRDVSVATSGQSERGARAGDRILGHIVDPRSGAPVPAYGSVTVLAVSAFEADALATALYVMGPDQGLEWAARHPELQVLYLVQESGRLRARGSAGFRAYLRGVDPAVRLELPLSERL